MVNIKDFIKNLDKGDLTVDEQLNLLSTIEQTIKQQKLKEQNEKIKQKVEKNVDFVVAALKDIESQLEAKLDELNKTPARVGAEGPKGKDGKDGKNGKDGLNGRDGVNGVNGKDGKDGVDGSDGISVVDARVDFDGGLVITLSDGSEVDAGQIFSSEVAQNIQIFKGGGGGTSLPDQAGNSGKYLSTDGSVLSWETVSGGGGSGDVAGPASATDNAIARFDGTTGKLIQNSSVTIDDTGNIANATLTAPTINGNIATTGLNIDSNTLVVDAVNDRVGVGTASPTNAKLVVSGGTASGSIMSVDTSSTTSFVRMLGDVTNQNLINWQSGTALRFATSIQDFGSFAERMRIDSSGNVGIGVTNPSNFDVTGQRLVVGSGSGTQGMSIYSGTASTGNLLFAKGTTGDDPYKGLIRYDHASNFMSYWTNAAERMRITTTGAISFGSSGTAYGTTGQVLTSQGNATPTWTDVVTPTGTQTLTNKRINPRAVTGGTSGTLTIDGDATDVYNAFNLTGAITFAAPSGTPVDGQRLMIRVEDNGSARGITWTTSSGAFRAIGVTLPTTTVASKVTYVGCVYNSTDVFWDVIAVATQA